MKFVISVKMEKSSKITKSKSLPNLVKIRRKNSFENHGKNRVNIRYGRRSSYPEHKTKILENKLAAYPNNKVIFIDVLN